jgi:hypothetical protein
LSAGPIPDAIDDKNRFVALSMEADNAVGDSRIPGELPTAVASSSALRARTDAMSPRSPSRKDSAVSKRVVMRVPRDIAPLFNVVLADEDQVDRDSKPAERATQANELGVAVSQVGLDDEKVEIAIWARLSLYV